MPMLTLPSSKSVQGYMGVLATPTPLHAELHLQLRNTARRCEYQGQEL